ncbi:hypothetical protein [Sphingomonas sp.]|uniref:hypothetical protein n=1 Tax=Sphingomonas sp. TaxID=28214 RepID=UPI003CC59F1D
MLGQPKPFASLSGGLLARKGAARPAMRPQSYASLTPTAQQLEDLGWDDMGGDHAVAEPVKPPVLVVREALAEAVAAPVDDAEAVETPVEMAVEAPPVVRSVSVATATRLSRETAHAGRAAFTLRLDAERHLRLRLASALANQSAQQLVAHALDRLLVTMPEVDALAAQCPPQALVTKSLARNKGKRS